MESIIIRKNRGTSPEADPQRQGPVRETSDIPEVPLPVMRPPKTEFPRRIPTPQEVIEGDIVPNPYTDLDAARANVRLAYGEPEALK
jgi:hypothetical protein